MLKEVGAGNCILRVFQLSVNLQTVLCMLFICVFVFFFI